MSPVSRTLAQVCVAVVATACAFGGVAWSRQEPESASPLVGKTAPDFTLKDLDGKDVKLSELKGTTVVLDFWATWCGPCRKGLPVLDAIAKERADKKLKVFAVNLQEEHDVAAKFKAQTKLGLPVLLDTDGKVGAAYNAEAIPLTVVIGPDGVVKKVTVGLVESEKVELPKLLDQLIAESK